MPDDLLSPQDFYDAVGASYKAISQAMEDLKIEPLRLILSDLRRTQYKHEWVEPVRKQILENAKNRKS